MLERLLDERGASKSTSDGLYSTAMRRNFKRTVKVIVYLLMMLLIYFLFEAWQATWSKPNRHFDQFKVLAKPTDKSPTTEKSPQIRDKILNGKKPQPIQHRQLSEDYPQSLKDSDLSGIPDKKYALPTKTTQEVGPSAKKRIIISTPTKTNDKKVLAYQWNPKEKDNLEDIVINRQINQVGGTKVKSLIPTKTVPKIKKTELKVMTIFDNSRKKQNVQRPKAYKTLRLSTHLTSAVNQPAINVNNYFKTNQTRALMRQGKLFLRKMRDTGIRYSTGAYYPNGDKKPSIFYRIATSLKGKRRNATVFLLHGKKYNSAIWLCLGTLYELARIGFGAVALDLPEYGKSKNMSELDPAVDRAKLLRGIMSALAPSTQRFLVSPGMSGIYSVPIVMNTKAFLKGVVFIAPAFTSSYPTYRYTELRIPTLVFYGQNDTTMLPYSSLDNLEHLKNKKIFILPEASHDCYVDQPEKFHRLLKIFLVYGIKKGTTYTNDRKSFITS